MLAEQSFRAAEVHRVNHPAGEAKAYGSQHFCKGSTWRELKGRHVEAVCDMARKKEAPPLNLPNECEDTLRHQRC